MGQVDTRVDEQDVAPRDASTAEGISSERQERIYERTAKQGLTVYDSMLLFMVIVWAANPGAIKWALDYIIPCLSTLCGSRWQPWCPSY